MCHRGQLVIVVLIVSTPVTSFERLHTDFITLGVDDDQVANCFCFYFVKLNDGQRLWHWVIVGGFGRPLQVSRIQSCDALAAALVRID